MDFGTGRGEVLRGLAGKVQTNLNWDVQEAIGYMCTELSVRVTWIIST